MDTSRRQLGDAVRREVLGADHVDRTTSRTTAFTADFQDFITRYAWGEIWARPGLWTGGPAAASRWRSSPRCAASTNSRSTWPRRCATAFAATR